MNTWVEGIQNAIEYVESHLTEDIQIRDVAEKAYVSEFHFQRIFTVLCGFSVSEYIRNRRMVLAARELAGSDAKVIDIALKYGYDSPDSFARAFTKFHGITPSAAKEKGAKLRDFAPVRINLSLEGGLPNCRGYKLGGNYNIEMYGPLCEKNPGESYVELWLPIEKLG